MSNPLDVCFDVWHYQKQSGYVYVSIKDDSGFRDQRFKWPNHKDRIVRWFRNHKDLTANVYWCPLIFNDVKRRKEYVKGGKTLYADLDLVNPKTLSTKPTIAWKTSNGRYQAIWFLTKSLSAKALESLNKQLTYHIKADKGGWDLTQVLRIPGTKNYKYTPCHQGKLLWHMKYAYTPNDFNLKKDTLEPGPYIADDDRTLVELLSLHRKLIPKKISRLLQYPPSRVEPGHRSDILWYIENELIATKIPLEDIIQIIRLSSWNKYKGRSDEWIRLKTEIDKVYQDKVVGGREVDVTLKDETSDTVPKIEFKSFRSLMSGLHSKPGWLVKDIWLQQSHGMIAGEPKTFKSTISMDIAISIASGLPLWNLYKVEESGPVIYIQNEDAEWIIKDRVEKIMASKKLIGRVQKKSESLIKIKFARELPIDFLTDGTYNFNDPSHRASVEDRIKKIRPVLVVFDPLYLMFDGDINSAQDLQPILSWLIRLKKTYRTGILIVHHWNKAGLSPRGGQRMLGSTTLHGWTESAMYLQRNDLNCHITKGGVDQNNKVAKILMEREFRAAGLHQNKELEITMGEIDEPIYEVKPIITSTSSTLPFLLMNLLRLYPEGLSLRSVAKELGVSRKSLDPIILELNDKIETLAGANRAIILKLRRRKVRGTKSHTSTKV